MGGGRGGVSYTSAQHLVNVSIFVIRASENRSGQVKLLSPLSRMTTKKII